MIRNLLLQGYRAFLIAEIDRCVPFVMQFINRKANQMAFFLKRLHHVASRVQDVHQHKDKIDTSYCTILVYQFRRVCQAGRSYHHAQPELLKVMNGSLKGLSILAPRFQD